MAARWFASLRGLLRRGAARRELGEELEFHVEMETRANVERGMAPAEARRVALRDLGGLTQTAEAAADVRSTFADWLWQDVRSAVRSTRAQPTFAAAAVLLLAVGVGANTTIFTLVNALLIRPLPVRAPAELRFLSVRFPERNSATGVPLRTLHALAGRHDLFAGVAGFHGDAAKLGTGLATTQVYGERVTSNYFDVLGIRPALGRTFVASDDVPEAAPVVVVSDGFWRTRLGGDPNAIGSTLVFRAGMSMNDTYLQQRRAYTIVGVMPAGFDGLGSAWVPAQYWAPLRHRTRDQVEAAAEAGGWPVPPDAVEARMNSVGAFLVARTRADASDDAVRAALAAASAQMDEVSWATARGLQRIRGTIVEDTMLGKSLPFAGAWPVRPGRLGVGLLILSSVVLLIAGINLTGLLLARGVARRPEFAMRLALGAGAGRIARQVFIETTLLALTAAVMALLLSRALVHLFLFYVPQRIGGPGASSLTAIAVDAPLDLRVLAFTVVLSLAAGLVIALTPVWQAVRTDVRSMLAGGLHGAPATERWRLRRWLVVPQIALSLVLLVAAAVLLRGVTRAELTDRGFDAGRTLYVDVATPLRYFAAMTPEARRAEDARRRATYVDLLDRVRALPGVQQAALATKSAWNGQESVSVVSKAGAAGGERRWVQAATVSAGYFDTAGIRLLRGRPFGPADTAGGEPVAVVCERLARQLWPEGDGIGEYVAQSTPDRADEPQWLRVVGIVEEIRVPGDEGRPTAFLYLPLEQQPRMPAASILLRAERDPDALATTAAEAIAAALPEGEIRRVRTMREEIAEVLFPQRAGAAIVALAGVFGLLLSTLGLYGVVSYMAARRLKEVGIRSAMGASIRHLYLLLLRDSAVLLMAGIAAGAALAVAAVRVASSAVVSLPGVDAATLLGTALVLASVTLAACIGPVRRAARVNPVDVLRGL